MDDYVMFTLSKSPHKNWIDRGQVIILETQSDLMEFDLDEGSCIMYEYKYCLHRFFRGISHSLKYISPFARSSLGLFVQTIL